VEQSRQFEQQVEAALGDNLELKAYLRELERRIDSGISEAGTPDLPPAGDLIGDLEAYLRQQRGSGKGSSP
jgi:hypothetical protein